VCWIVDEVLCYKFTVISIPSARSFSSVLLLGLFGFMTFMMEMVDLLDILVINLDALLLWRL